VGARQYVTSNLDSAHRNPYDVPYFRRKKTKKKPKVCCSVLLLVHLNMFIYNMDQFAPSFPPTQPSCFLVWRLPIDPLAQTISSSFLDSGWPILPPSIALLSTLYKLSTSQHPHFNPEDGNSMFLQNSGIYLWVHMVSQPRTTTLTRYCHFLPCLHNSTLQIIPTFTAT
jgi:hypothetical protein